MSAIETAVMVVFWVALMLALLRWPFRAIGAGVALVLWTAVGDWAFWTALVAFVLGAVAWRRLWRREPLLEAHPELRLLVVGAVLAVVVQGWIGLVGLIVALAVVVRLAWSWPPLVVHPDRAVTHAPVPTGDQRFDGPAAGFLGAGALVTDTATCDRCGGIVVASAQLPTGPDAVGLAQAVCTGCGLRLTGVVNPSAPTGQQVVWIETPTDRWEESA